jgi:class 3 adenylate cyclase/tetratricopeptide (TPR) repeat protein
MRVCGGCATPLTDTVNCRSCGRANPPEQKFCNGCGQPVLRSADRAAQAEPRAYTPKHLAERILAEQAAMESRGAQAGERKMITALFADIKGSMELIEDLDPEEARSIIDPALELMIESVHRYEGYVAQSTGDGIFAIFGAPIAHEDHSRRALYAALRMQEEVRRFAEKLRAEKGVNLEIRVGINTGEVVVRSIRKDDLHTDYVPIGHSTSLAARLQGLATGGTIVVSEETRKLTDGYFRFKGLGAARIKGVSEPVEIHEVTGVGPLRTKLEVSARRGLSRFTGRQREMELLRQALELARGGHGRIVGAIGEPGVGKSRLFHEFKLSSQSGCLVLETFSVSHGKASAYLPVIELLKGYFQITVEDDERRRREKVIGKLLALERSLEDVLPYLFSLLGIPDPDSALQGMDSGIRRRRTLEALKRLLLRESLNQPLIVVFEDLHWLDGESQAFLDLLTESVGGAHILLLVNYRPEYRHDWSNKSFYAQLRLDPLNREGAGEMLAALLGDGSELEPLKRLVIEKTEGNPFFMEEMTQALFDQGFLVRDTAVRLTRPIAELRVPTTVQGVLASRIDRLGAEEKELLQILSVIGRVCPLSLIQQITSGSEDRLERWLATLQAGEFLYEQPGIPETEYVFKHALTQEVAYGSLLNEQRRRLHERIAQAIESVFPGRLEDQYGSLARHYRLSDNPGKAVYYLERAAEQAVARSANAEAGEHLDAALSLLERLPQGIERDRRELRLQMARGALLTSTRGFGAPERERVCERARDLCKAIGESEELLPIFFQLGQVYISQGRFGAARELVDEAQRAAESVGDRVQLIFAHHNSGECRFWAGEITDARFHLERGTALYDRSCDSRLATAYGVDPLVLSGGFLASSDCLLGRPDHGLRRARALVDHARELSHPLSLAVALFFVAGVSAFRREVREMLESVGPLFALSTERGFPEFLAWARFYQGQARAALGDLDQGIGEMIEGLSAFRSTNAQLAGSWLCGELAWACARAGRRDQAERFWEEAFDSVERFGQRLYEAEVLRLRGEAMLCGAADAKAEAERFVRRAIDVARRQGVKLFELRATTSLARLLKNRGEKPAARAMLSGIYSAFTEGFDTADLKDAKALLEELP